MKTDLLTKILLSVIALNLTVLTLHFIPLVPAAQASSPHPLVGTLPQGNYGLVPLNDDGSITVKLSAFERLDVNIVGISTIDELDVNIEEIGGRNVPHGGPIEVKVK